MDVLELPTSLMTAIPVSGMDRAAVWASHILANEVGLPRI